MSSILPCHVRPMIRRDLEPGLLAIENDLDDNGHVTRLTKKAVLVNLKTCHHVYLVAAPEDVRQEKDGLFGYVSYQYGENGWIEIHRLVVAKKYRRRKVATRLLAGVIAAVKSSKRHSIEMFVNEYLLDLHLFLRSRGVKASECVPSEVSWMPEEGGLIHFEYSLPQHKSLVTC